MYHVGDKIFVEAIITEVNEDESKYKVETQSAKFYVNNYVDNIVTKEGSNTDSFNENSPVEIIKKIIKLPEDKFIDMVNLYDKGSRKGSVKNIQEAINRDISFDKLIKMYNNYIESNLFEPGDIVKFTSKYGTSYLCIISVDINSGSARYTVFDIESNIMTNMIVGENDKVEKCEVPKDSMLPRIIASIKDTATNIVNEIKTKEEKLNG